MCYRYALLVGVGGSGKQSLARLAAYISGLEVFQISLKKGYGISDLKVDLAAQYMKVRRMHLDEHVFILFVRNSHLDIRNMDATLYFFFSLSHTLFDAFLA